LQTFSAVVRDSSAEGHCRRLTLALQKDVAFAPGQFVGVRVSPPGSSDPLLLRPLSVADWRSKNRVLQLIVKPVGRGTRFLCEIGAGATLDCLGPLGNGFPINHEGSLPWIVGGGIGAAPLLYLARVLAVSGTPPVTFLAAAEDVQLISRDEFAVYSSSLHVATEDGSAGFEGLVTELLRRHTEQPPYPDVLYCCGPKPMMSEIADISLSHQWKAYGSFEEHMACGVGACLGCAILAAEGDRYLHVCSDGPVFDLQEVQLDE